VGVVIGDLVVYLGQRGGEAVDDPAGNLLVAVPAVVLNEQHAQLVGGGLGGGDHDVVVGLVDLD
jgi:hypothetical protein